VTGEGRISPRWRRPSSQVATRTRCDLGRRAEQSADKETCKCHSQKFMSSKVDTTSVASANVSKAVQEALISILKIPTDDFSRSSMSFRATASCTRRRFSDEIPDDFIVLELAFISGRPKETASPCLKELNARMSLVPDIADDLMIQLSEARRDFSFGQGLAQRALSDRQLRENRHADCTLIYPAPILSSG